jgi:hypothetical protein
MGKQEKLRRPMTTLRTNSANQESYIQQTYPSEIKTVPNKQKVGKPTTAL